MNRSTGVGMEQLELTAGRSDHYALIQGLAVIAQGLASVRGEDGITIADVRREAEHQCIRLPEKLHFLGAVMKAAGLVRTGAFRRSDVEASHGNAHRVWRRPS